MRHPHTILVHQDTPGALSHHHLTRNPSYSTVRPVAVAAELQCCLALGRRIAVGYTFVLYVTYKDVSAITQSPQVSINPRGCVWRHRPRSP